MKKQKIDEYRKGYCKLVVLLIVIVIYIVTNKFFSIVQVNGNSMNDYLMNNAICVVDKKDFTVKRYDVVIARMDHTTSIKRVVALPNDIVKIENGIVFINGNRCSQYDYYTEKAGIAQEEIQLGEDEYFLLGDNREISYDSREYGVFDREKIKGKVIKVLWRGNK